MLTHDEEGGNEKTKILLVEDDKYLSIACKERLLEENFDVLVAESGEDALQYLETRDRPHLILLDIILPKRNGFDILEEIRLSDNHSDIPVVIFTNLAQESDREKGIALGALDYLVKTDFSLREIVQKIREHTARVV